MPPTHTTEGLDAARTLAADRTPPSGSWCSRRTSSRTTRWSCSSPARAARATCSRSGSPTSRSSPTPLRRVAAGGVVVDPSVVAQLVGRRRVRNPLDDLTERERDVLAVMAEGGRTRDRRPAAPSPKTVEAYVRSVFTKLGLHAAPDDNRRVLAVLQPSCAADGTRPRPAPGRAAHSGLRPPATAIMCVAAGRPGTVGRGRRRGGRVRGRTSWRHPATLTGGPLAARPRGRPASPPCRWPSPAGPSRAGDAGSPAPTPTPCPPRPWNATPSSCSPCSASCAAAR